MKFLLLLAFVGCAVALQSAVEYEYSYKARVGTGVQSGQPQYSATGIQANVKVTVGSDGEATIKMSEVKVGDINDVVGNNGRNEMPISYQPIQDKSIEQPFSASLKKIEGQGPLMKVPRNDLLWVTNVRRGVVDMLRIAPLLEPSTVRPSSHSGRQSQPQAFSRIEDTYAGRCLVSYSIALNGDQDSRLSVNNDIQHQNARKGPSGDEVKLNGDMYLLQVSIDFNTCQDRVVLLQTGVGNLTNVSSTTFRDVATRAYVSQYVLRGEPGKFRIEEAIVESHYLYNPYGIDSDKMSIISNQTLKLESAKPASRYAGRMEGDTKDITTWRQQLQSPNSRPSGYAPSWMVYKKENEQPFNPIFYEKMASGFGLTEQAKSSTKQKLESEIKEASQRLFGQNKDASDKTYGGSEDGVGAQQLDHARRLVRWLPKNELKQVWETLKQQQQQKSCMKCLDLYKEVLAVAASGSSVDLLLEKITSHEISENRTVSIFFNLANNIQSPEVVEKLMRYVMSLQETDHVLLSIVSKLNFALVARRLCISEQVKEYSHMNYVFGDKMCNRDSIIHTYIPNLEQKIEHASQMWVKIVNVMALGDLGAKESLRTLERAARGEISNDIFLRIAAIHSMNQRQFDNTTKYDIFNIIQPIAESQREDYRVRQVAYDTIFSWRPNATFVQRMAFMSQTEPSRQMQSYIYWAIDSLSKINDPRMRDLTNVARDVLPFTQYMNPSLYRSMNYMSSKYLPDELVGWETDNAWFTSFKSEFPNELYSYVSGKFGRFNIPLLETVAFGNSQEAYASLRQLFEGMSRSRSAPVSSRNSQQRRDEQHKQRIADLIRDKSSEAGSGSAPSSAVPDLYYYARMFSSSEIFLPLTDQLYSRFMMSGVQALKNMREGEEYTYQKFFNPVEINAIMPTPVGLFCSIEVSTPTVFIGNATAKLLPFPAIDNPSDLPALEKIELVAEGLTKIISKVNSYSYIFAPWTNKTVVSGIDNEKSLSLPMRIQLVGQLRMPVQELWGQITPKFNSGSDNVPIMKARNLPFTAFGDGYPGGASRSQGSQFTDLRKIMWGSGKQQLQQVVRPLSEKMTGLKAEIRYNGEPRVPGSQSDVYALVSEPSRLMALITSPSIKYYDLSLYQRAQPETKNIGFSVRYMVKQGSGPQITTESAKQPLDVSPDDSLQQREQKLAQFSDKENTELSMKLNFTGSEAKKYEMSIIGAREERNQQSSSKHQYYKVQVAFLEKNSEDNSQNHKPRTCFVASVERPVIQPMTDLEHMLESNQEQSLTTNFMADAYEGTSCQSSSSIGDSKGSISISSTRARNIVEHMKRERSVFNGTSEFYRIAVYDQLSFEGSWKQSSPLMKNLTMRGRDLAEGYLFPKISKNHYDTHSSNKIVVHADRSISDDRAMARIELPWETIVAQGVNVRPWFDFITGFTADVYSAENRRRSLSVSSPGDKCEITPQQVKTFDAVTYEKLPTTCETILAKLRQGEDNLLVLSKQVSQSPSSEQELHILSTKDRIDVTMKESSIKINGQEMQERSKIVKDSSGNVLMKLLKIQGMVEAEIPTKMKVLLKQRNQVQIKLDPRFKNATKGLCGDFDSESVDDLRAPNQCVFRPSEGKKYAASWVAQKSQCNEPQMKQLFQQLSQSESSCFKGRRLSSGGHNCGMQGYLLKQIENYDCESADRLQVCPQEQHCSTKESKDAEIRFNCWDRSHTPREVRDSMSRGYTTTRHSSPAPDHRMTHKMQVPTSCQRRVGTGKGDAQCYTQGYPVRSTGPLLCIAQSQYQVCKPECRVTDTHPQQVQSKCWNRDDAPEPVKQAVPAGYSQSPPPQNSEFTSELTMDQPIGCYKP